MPAPTSDVHWNRGGAARPLPMDGGREETPQRPNSQATPKGLDQSSKMEEVVPKMALRRGSDTGQYMLVRSCRGCPQELQEEFSFHFTM